MVVLEAAAIGAAGYGLYKGGEAGVEKGKQCHKEFQHEKKRSSQRSVLYQKTKSRSQRIAEIVSMKKKGGNDSTTSMSEPSTNTTTTSTFAARRKSMNEASSEIDNRHRAVMQKLASGRQEESKKSSKLRSLNPFKKK